jgi:diaminopimelate decarboxylase
MNAVTANRMITNAPWWQSASLTIEMGTVALDGTELESLARMHGTPLYVYSRPTVQRRLSLLQTTLAQATSRFQIYYAMKANRHPAVLSAVRAVEGIGIDCCSPREVATALANGFAPQEISFNAGMLSNRDLACVAAAGVHCTLDSFSALRRYGERVRRGTRVGLRFDPGVAASYNEQPKLVYGKSKFGFAVSECCAAVDAAQCAGLVVDSVAMHIGWGIPESSAEMVEMAFAQLATVASQCPDLESINVGGGLGGRYQIGDKPLALETWRDLIGKHLAPLGVTLLCEPGTWVVATAGLLIVEVNTVETRRGIHWVGVDAGYALNVLPAMYDIPLEVIPLCNPSASPVMTAHIAGHINEGIDIWAKTRPVPELCEGDLIAFFPAGAYGSSMASDHCLRGQYTEVAVG